MSGLASQWPRPRVGQYVILRSGKVGEVVTVRKARDVLRGMNEVEAMLLGPKSQALYGVGWMDVYYEADVRIGHDLRKVTPSDVERILDRPPVD